MSTNAAEIEEKEVEVIEAEDDTSAELEVVEEEKQEEESESKEEELEQYSKSVQTRINKLTHRYREEEAQRKAAVDFAAEVKKQNDELKSRLESLDQSYVGEFDTRIKSQAEAAKQAYQKAYEEGDADGMFEAQKNISRLALDEAQLDQARKKARKGQCCQRRSKQCSGSATTSGATTCST